MKMMIGTGSNILNNYYSVFNIDGNALSFCGSDNEMDA